jgi:ribosomal protein L11 methyltransferase
MRKKYSVVIVKPKAKKPQEIEWDLLIAKATSDYNCQGVVEFDLNESQIDDVLGRRAYAGVNLPEVDRNDLESRGLSLGVGLQFCFYHDEHAGDAQRFVEFLCQNHSELEVKSQQSDWQDWNQGFRDSFQAQQVSTNIEVVPAWEKDDSSDEAAKHTKVYINPGMGFGTGSHETTALCLHYLDQEIGKYLNQNDRCLDFGCGSGILGIAAIKIYNLQLDFCDIDREALDNCQQNILLNFPQHDLSSHRLVSRERFKVEQPYKVVFANILESVLVQEQEVIFSAVDKGGYLILSGVLEDQVDRVAKLYTENNELELLDSKLRGEWGALLLGRRV